MDDKIKYYLVMRNDVIELGFKNMDKFGADLFCLVMREIRRNVEKLNKNDCTFEYRELKEILNIDDHLSYEMYKKEIDRFKKTIMSCWYEFENEEVGVEMAVFTEVINDKKNRTITVKANPDFLDFFLPSSRFTYISLKEFCSLKTMYSKRLYAFLKQFRNTGYRRVSVERFREYMDATSKTYDDFAQLRRRVITPAVNELMYSKRLFILLKQFRNTGYRSISVESFREYMGADDKTYNDYAQLKRRVLLPAVNELVEKGYIKGLQVDEIKGNSGKKVEGLLFKFWAETQIYYDETSLISMKA